MAQVTVWLFAGLLCTILIAWALCAWPTGFGNETRHELRAEYGYFSIHCVPARGVRFANILLMASPPEGEDAEVRRFPTLWQTRLGERTGAKTWDARGVWTAEDRQKLIDNVELVEAEVAAGWPVLAFSWYKDRAGVATGAITVGHGGTLVPKLENGQVRYRTMWSPRRLPYLPIWPGLIVNTLLYGIICAGLWTMFCACFRRVLKARRTRKGLCGNCGYDCRGLTAQTCPECGSVPGLEAAPVVSQ